MGIIIMPVLLGALGLSVFALVQTVRLFRSKEISTKELLWGFLISALIFGLICLSYIMKGSAWEFSPVFRIPIFMVFVPFGIYILSRIINNPKLKYFATLLLISIALTGILGIVFNNLLFGLPDILGVEKHY